MILLTRLGVVVGLALTVFCAAGLDEEAQAADITSTYSKIDLDQCSQIEPPSEEFADGGSWQCPGFQGIPVYVAEGDLRMFVSFGEDAADQPAATQTLPNFNTVNDTLEWRLRDGRPFATILRWFPTLEDGVSTGSVLIVTQLEPAGGICQIARIDARSNQNANVLARQAADRLAGSFDCAEGPHVIGAPGILGR